MQRKKSLTPSSCWLQEGMEQIWSSLESYSWWRGQVWRREGKKDKQLANYVLEQRERQEIRVNKWISQPMLGC